MSVVKCFTVALLLLLTSAEAAFVKKYLEAKLLAQMLNNAPEFHDTSMMATYSMFPKPNDNASPQITMPWKTKFAPPAQPQSVVYLGQGSSTHFDELDAHSNDHAHFDLSSQRELNKLMMETRSATTTATTTTTAATMAMKDSTKPGSIETIARMHPAAFASVSTKLPFSYSNNEHTADLSMKNLMSSGELEALVEKTREMNKDIGSEFSDDEIRHMIAQGMANKALGSSGDGKSLDDLNEDEMDQMNIMKPVDRLPGTVLSNRSAGLKEPFTTPQPMAIPSMLPQFPMPIPPARLTFQQTSSQQGLMSRMPQVFRSALNTFALGGQRRIPTGWNTPLGVSSMSGLRLNQIDHYGNVPIMNFGVHTESVGPHAEAMMYPKRFQPPLESANPAYLGYIHQNRGTQPLRNVSELRSQLEKMISEIDRNSHHQKLRLSGQNEKVDRTSSRSSTSVPEVADLRANQGDLRRLKKTEASLQEETKGATSILN